MSMDQIGQSKRPKGQKANRVKPRPKDGERPREIPLHRDLFGGSDPRYVSQAPTKYWPAVIG